MATRDNSPTAKDNNKAKALTWLRGALGSALEVAPLPPWMKKRTAYYIQRLPNWLTIAWATAWNVDFMDTYANRPDLPAQMQSHIGRRIIQQYLETHEAVHAANALRSLVGTVLKLLKAGRLPAQNEMIEKQVVALALCSFSPAGRDFADRAKSILSNPAQPNHILVDYRLALERRDTRKLEELDAALAGGRYGNWVAERLAEAKRWLGLEPPQLRIHHGERTPQWDALWQSIFLGGEK